MIVSSNIYLANNILCDFIQKKTKSAFSKRFDKKYYYSTPYQTMPSKIISMSPFKVSIFHAKFRSIPCNKIRNRAITKILRKTE